MMKKLSSKMKKPSFGSWLIGTAWMLVLAVIWTACVFGLDSGFFWLIQFILQRV